MCPSLGTEQSLLDQGIAFTEAGRFGDAAQNFLAALSFIEASPDDPGRLRRFGVVANLALSAGHPDIALMALQRSLVRQGQRDEPGRYCADLLTLANCWSTLARPAASAAVNKIALATALKYKRFADAASASTNLAASEASSGRLRAALKRLRASLKLLEKGANPKTDAITRLSLLQVVDAMQADPAIALDASADLFTRLQPHVGPERWGSVAPAFHRLVDRHLAAHPELDAAEWKRKTFPLVFG